MTVTYNSHPYGLFTYTSPSNKLLRQNDGVFRFGAHNLYLNSAAPANQSITVVSGATYSVTITGTVSVTASGAATGTWTAGTTTFTAATGTLTLGSTSGAGTVHVRRTPSNSLYLETGATARYALPFEWDASGNLIGMVREPAATNLIRPSVPASATGLWATSTNVTYTTGQADPFGGTNAVSLSATASAATNLASTAIVIASTAVTVSWIVKKGSGATDANKFGVRNNTTASNLLLFTVDYDTLAVTYTTGAAGVSVQSIGDGWIRIIATVSSGITSGDGLIVYTMFRGVAETAGESAIVAHVQIEAGTAVTSPIITHNATAARAEDQISVATSVLPAIGTNYALYFEGEILSGNLTTFPRAVSFTGSSPNDDAQIFVNSSDQVKLFARDNNVTQADVLSTLTATTGTTFRVVGAFAADNFRISADGGAVQSDVSGTLPTQFTSLLFGHLGHFRLRKAAVFYRNLSDAEMISLSGTGALS